MSFTVAGVLLTGLLGSACSTVQSIDVSKADTVKRRGTYLNYSVAKSLFTIQISAASSSAKTPPIPASPAQPAAAAAPAASGGGGASPVTWTLSGTLSSGSGGGGASGGSQGSTPTDSSACAAKTAEYAAAQAVVAGQIATYATLTVRLTQLQYGVPAKGDTPQQLATDLKAYVDAVAAPSYRELVSANGGVPGVRKTATTPEIPPVPGLYDELVSKCPPKVSVTIQQTIVPDPTRTFALRARTNIFYADALTLGVDANGFLTNGAAASTSQVTAIASAVANDVGLFVLPSPVTPVGPALQPRLAAGPSCPPGEVIGLYPQIAALGSCKPGDANAQGLARQVLADLATPGSLRNLPAATLPLTLYAPIEDLLPGGQTATSSDVQAQMTDVKAKYGLDLGLSCSERKFDAARSNDTPENAPALDGNGAPVAPGVYDGLVVSASKACRFLAKQTLPDAAAPVTLGQTYLWAQDSRDLVILPTRRGFLVARSVGYTFSNGQATGVTDSRPSEALAFVSFPGAVVGSFFSGVTSAATNGQAFTAGKTANLTAQTNYLTAQTNNLTAQAALKSAQSGAPPASK